MSTCGVSPADLKNDISMLACWGEEMIQKPIQDVTYLGLALKNQSSSDNPIILVIERYQMTSYKSRL